MNEVFSYNVELLVGIELGRVGQGQQGRVVVHLRFVRRMVIVRQKIDEIQIPVKTDNHSFICTVIIYYVYSLYFLSFSFIFIIYDGCVVLHDRMLNLASFNLIETAQI